MALRVLCVLCGIGVMLDVITAAHVGGSYLEDRRRSCLADLAAGAAAGEGGGEQADGEQDEQDAQHADLLAPWGS